MVYSIHKSSEWLLEGRYPAAMVPAIRILPMSESDPEFVDCGIEDVQRWFLETLPYTKYHYTKGLHTDQGSLVLFQFQGHIIASAILTEKVEFAEKLDGTYRGYYQFNDASILVFTPVNVSEMREIWVDFKGFTQATTKLDASCYQAWLQLLSRRKTCFAKVEVSEEFFQSAVEGTVVEDWEIDDQPKLPVSITVKGGSKKWARSAVEAKKAIVLADYQCEFDASHRSFTSKVTGRNFVEAHHLIPIEHQENYPVSLDVSANIVSLCPNCHRAVHHASEKERETINRKLLSERAERLRKCGIDVVLFTGKVLEVDDISSIAAGIFSFKYKNRVIEEAPFRLKYKLESNGASPYHLDKDDLLTLSQWDARLRPFEESSRWTKREYILEMKQYLYQLVIDGEFLELLGRLYDQDLSGFTLKWSGAEPPVFKG